MRRQTLPPPRDVHAGLRTFDETAPPIAHGAASTVAEHVGKDGDSAAAAAVLEERGQGDSAATAGLEPSAHDPAAGSGGARTGVSFERTERRSRPRLTHGRLREPAPALPRLRRLFDPRSGWFRLLERKANLFLSAHIYPHVPGIGIPYAAQLDRHLTVSEADIRLVGLPRALGGLKILLMTDIHAGPFLPPAALRRAFDRLAAEEPDLILLGGDLTTSSVEEIVPHLPAFASLAAPLGVFAVLGNHEHYTGDPAGVSRLLESANVGVLDNASVVIERAGAGIELAGIDDLYRGKPDLAAALAATRLGTAGAAERPAALGAASRPLASGAGRANEERATMGRVNAGLPPPVLLLSHNPDIFFDACRRGVSLVLSGHTHGGQIRIPGLPVLVRQSRYRLDEGRYTAGGAELVVSRGLGASGVPFRFACAPEAVLVRLHPA